MYQGIHITATTRAPHHYRDSTCFNSPLLTCRIYGFTSLSSYLYMSICSIQLEMRLSGNIFPFNNSPMSVLTSPDKACSQYVTGSSALKAHINEVSLNSLHADSCWWPSTEISSNLQKGLHLRHFDRFSFVIGLILAGYFSGHSSVRDLMFSWVPNIHCVLMEWLYGKILTSSLPYSQARWSWG